jgi:hypothetical protein
MTDGRVMRQSALVFSDMWRPRSIARSLSVRAGSCRPADRWHARRGRSRRALWPRLTAPLTRSSGFADGSLGAMLNPEPDAGQDAGLPGCVVLERRASMTDTKTLRNNRPNGIGDPERGERLGNQSRPGTSRDARLKGFSALASSGTRSSQTSRHLREYMFGQAPMCNQGDEPKHCEEAAGRGRFHFRSSAPIWRQRAEGIALSRSSIPP